MKLAGVYWNLRLVSVAFCFCRGNQRAIVGNLLNPADIFSPVYQIAVGNFESAAIAPWLKFFDRAPLTRPDGTGERAALLLSPVGEFARSRGSAGDILRGSPAGDDPGKSFADLGSLR